MTDEQFINSLDEDKQYWWKKNVAKYGSVEAVRQSMSGYTARRKTVGGFTDPEVLKKAQATRARNRKG
jgi:hypothetical protein